MTWTTSWTRRRRPRSSSSTEISCVSCTRCWHRCTTPRRRPRGDDPCMLGSPGPESTSKNGLGTSRSPCVSLTMTSPRCSTTRWSSPAGGPRSRQRPNLLARAVAMTPPGSPARHRRVLAAVDLAYSSGDSDGAARLAETALAGDLAHWRARRVAARARSARATNATRDTAARRCRAALDLAGAGLRLTVRIAGPTRRRRIRSWPAVTRRWIWPSVPNRSPNWSGTAHCWRTRSLPSPSSRAT